MIIPQFKEPTFKVYEMEFYINSEPSDIEEQFKRILESIKTFQRLPNISEMTAILEYETKALDYAFRLGINTLKNRDFEKDFVDIYNAVNETEVYSEALKDGIMFIKYCTLQKKLGELKVIHDIKNEVRSLTFKYNNYDWELLEAVNTIKGSKNSDSD